MSDTAIAILEALLDDANRQLNAMRVAFDAANAELAKAGEQEPSFWYIPAEGEDDEDALVLPARDGKCPSSYETQRAIPLYAAPVPAQPAVPEAVAKDAADKLALAYGYLWHVNNSTPGYDAPSDYTRPQLTPKDAAYKARGLLRDMLTNDQRGDGINRAAILSATDSEVKK